MTEDNTHQNENTNDPEKQTGEKNPGDNNTPELYKPDGLPDHYLGGNDQETIDKLYSAVTGFRKDQAKGKDVPKTADEYKLDIPDDLKDKVIKAGEDGKDPVLELFKPIMHKHNIGQAAFQDIALEISKAVAEKVDEAGAADEELADFSYDAFGGEEKAKPVIDGVSVWAKGLRNQDKLDDADIEEISMMSAHSQGLKLLSKLRELTGERPIPVDFSGGGDDGAVTEDMLNARIADPRYRPGKDFDKSFHDETTRMFAEFYG